ncbi:MAG: hypothetical protein AAB393_01245 [Bacteroidota bacterium]
MLLFVVPYALYSQEVRARASVDSTNYLVGDVVNVHLDVTHPKGAVLNMAVADTMEGFHVLDRPQFKSNTDTTSSGSLSVAKYDSGVAIVPPLELFYSLSGDTSLGRVSTNPLLLTIHTLAVDTSQAYKDLKPPLTIPLTLAEIALYLGIVLLVAALCYFGYRFWKKRQKKATGEVYVPPPRPAHIIALEELAALKEKKLWQKGLIKQYYSEVSEIVRRYVENRYRLMALEQTTDEIMYGLIRLQIKGSVCSKIETMLQLSDLVKFAKYQPGISEHEEILTMAFDIVEATKAVEVKQPVQTEQRVTANVES